MLVGVMKPKWSSRLPDFADELRVWELAVQRHEEATRFPMPDDVKCSVVSMRAPRAIQSYLRVSDTDLLANYTTLRQGIFRFLTRGRAFGNEGQLQGVPMELDAVTAPTRPWTRPTPGKGKGGKPGASTGGKPAAWT
eukprot:5089502-Heterocapsa_arctica.AAC.1